MALTDIDVPYPDAPDRHLRLALGACRIRIRPTEAPDAPAWVRGTYDDPSQGLPLRVTTDSGTVRNAQALDLAGPLGRIGQAPVFDVALSTAQPFALTLEGGASDSEIELGGVPLRRLVVRFGGGRQRIAVSAPNPEPLDRVDVSGGAADLELRGIGNLGASELTLDGGAARFHLDFGGQLARDLLARVNAGMAGVEIAVPASTSTRIETEAVFGGIDAGPGLELRDGFRWTPAALEGAVPRLDLRVKVVMGQVTLRLA